MSAIDQALSTIDQVATEGDLAPEASTTLLELESLTDPIVLPDGKRIYPPRLHGQPIDELACALIDTRHSRRVDVPAADRTARSRQEPDRPRDRLPPVARTRPGGRASPRRPVLRVRGDQRRPVQRRVSVPPRVRPRRRRQRHGPARRLRVRAGDARGMGGDDRRGQHDPRRRAAQHQLVPRRTPVAVPAGDRGGRCSPSPGSRACSPTTRAWSAPPTFPTRGTRGSPRRSRSRATGPRSPSSARRRPW